MVQRLAAAITLIPLFWTLSQGAGVTESEVSSLAGVPVKLPCVMGPLLCGNVHSMRWYKNGDERVYMFSPRAKLMKAEESLASRAKLEYTQNDPVAYLVIDKVELSDEGLFKCDITYLKIHDDCRGMNYINFTTLVKPENISIYDEEMVVPEGKYDKILTEDDDITLTCIGGRGKPVPSVQWWRGDTLLKANFDEEKDENGVGTGTNKVKIRASRNDLNVKYECRAYHPALDDYISTHTQLEVNVRPNKLFLSGVEHHVVKGTTVTLKCEVFGARPEATIKWFNGTLEMPPTTHGGGQNEGDGTYNTTSTLVFTATRWENDVAFTCEASNEIMTVRHEVPLRETLKLEVLYPPYVHLVPENHTVNETMDVLIFCNYEANPSTILGVKWFKDDEELDWDTQHYIGGNLDHLPLLIKNATRNDMGRYMCELRNEVDVGRANNSVYVSVQYKPEVNLTMDPPSPIVEDVVTNVTMTCNVIAGNPSKLNFVRWFSNGQLIHQLPDCNSDNNATCVDDPSKLMLMNLGRELHGNYSCMGMNDAGWGAMSPDAELIVYYPPSKVSLTFTPDKVKKRQSVTLMCSVEDLGRPDNTTFRWTRGGQTMLDVTTANWTIDPVTLETKANFTCTAVNLGGESDAASQFIDVRAPPAFIERLPPYFGALMTSQNISISCRVECSPACVINWHKGTNPIDPSNNRRYYVENKLLPPDPRTNDFESVLSTLYFNMSAWSGGSLDRMTDNANYSCVSSGNAVGKFVKSTTLFAVEYPPENLTLTNKVVNVIEGNIPEKVLCSAKAFPEASYQWRREGEPDVIVKGNALILNHPVSKRNGGNYTCEAYNRHGNNSLTTFINVLYRPECGITKKEVDGKVVLVCTAQANPPDVDFAWKIKNENETIEDDIEKKGLQSILTLETRVENFRTYLCFPNNSVGITKKPCEVDVSGTVGWWGRLDKDAIMILIAILTGIILVIIIVAIIICIVCRRKRAADKCPNPSNNKDLASSPNDALLPNDADKAFYENLPFHNMANPQNKRMMNGEPSTGTRHHHHTHHSGGRTRRKHHRRAETDACRYRPGSAPASPPPTSRYQRPESPPHQTSYQTPHYPTYTTPRSKADYTFIKFHDVGQEIDV